MLKKASIIALAFILSSACAAMADEPAQKAFHAEIINQYNFQPHTLTDKEIDRKSGELDQFWNKVKAKKDLYLPLLRAELSIPSNPSFFYYDGSKLLLSLSDTIEDRKIALGAILRADLRDIQHEDYVRTVHAMARSGLDTTAAAFRILADPEFKAIIPQHALTLGQDFCLIYMLIPTREEYYLQKLIDRLRTETDVTAQKSILQMLWYTVTKQGDDAVRMFSDGAGKPEASRTWAKDLLDRNSKTGLGAALTLSSYASLKKKRQEVMGSISDEALMEFDELTMKMIAKRGNK